MIYSMKLLLAISIAIGGFGSSCGH